MKAAFYTLGCKVNQYETQIMEQRLITAGYEIVSHEQPADVYVVNSCTVTGESDRKTRQVLRRLKAQNPFAITVLSGCFPQSSPNSAAAFEEADVVTGVLGRSKIDVLIAQARSSGGRVVHISGFEKDEQFEPMRASGFDGHTRAFVKIEDGCRSFCSYCIIPYSRGPVRSKPPAALQSELEEIAGHGYKEAVLVGINLSAYGSDLSGSLADAIEAANGVAGIERIRLGSLEPNIVTDDFLSRIKRCEKLCPHFHLALQSGCEATLRRMNRRYIPARFAQAVGKLREAYSDCGITTDIIVGFPGETQEEFAQSLAFVGTTGFSQGHVFSYSKRSGTKAAEMPDQVNNAEKSRRSRLMSEACARSKQSYLESLVGQVLPVLFEEEHDGVFGGFAPNYAPVHVHSQSDLQGRILNIEITGVTGGECCGKIV
jgi:threonylcarbamoyladenosine tRNA methylthiotransferase MtaB